MKKILLILTAMFVLSSCAAKEAPLRVTSASSSVESEAEIHTEVESIPPQGQQSAIDAYQEILNSFAVAEFPHDPGYPQEFADAYIGEDNFLYVCLTDITKPMQEKYCKAVKEPQILKFVEVEHSYHDLYALQMALAELNGLDFSFIGVDVTGNEVDLGIPDIGKEAAIRELMENGLPEEVRNRFEELPVSIEEASYATFG